MIKDTWKRAEPLFLIHNHHISDSGKPPNLKISNRYVSYFENCHGEQWVFIGDRKKKTIELRGGDIGWRRRIKATLDDPFPKLILNEAEKFWYVSCVMAMGWMSFADAVAAFDKGANRTADKWRAELKDRQSKEDLIRAETYRQAAPFLKNASWRKSIAEFIVSVHLKRPWKAAVGVFDCMIRPAGEGKFELTTGKKVSHTCTKKQMLQVLWQWLKGERRVVDHGVGPFLVKKHHFTVWEMMPPKNPSN